MSVIMEAKFRYQSNHMHLDCQYQLLMSIQGMPVLKVNGTAKKKEEEILSVFEVLRIGSLSSSLQPCGFISTKRDDIHLFQIHQSCRFLVDRSISVIHPFLNSVTWPVSWLLFFAILLRSKLDFFSGYRRKSWICCQFSIPNLYHELCPCNYEILPT